jgi:hypothetical protein
MVARCLKYESVSVFVVKTALSMPYRISTWTSRKHHRPGVLAPPIDLGCYRLRVNLLCGWLDVSQADPWLIHHQ